MRECGIRQRQCYLFFFKPLRDYLALHADYIFNRFRRQDVEQDYFIKPIEEFRAEIFFKLPCDFFFRLLVSLALASVRGTAEAQTRHLVDVFGADVRSHDDDGVFEVHRAPFRVGQTAVVEYLEKYVEHLRMRLLYLIEQNNGVWAVTHKFREPAAFVVADITRRRADHLRDGMLLHVFRHVHADERLLAVEEEFRKRARELRFSHARRPQEQEAAHRTIWVGNSRAASLDGV